MSLHFIIDGHNLLNQTSILNKINLKDHREALIRFLQIYRPQGSKNNRVTVVFDGRQGNFYFPPFPFLNVIFSDEDSADERIKKLVEQSSSPKNVVVVTNDREIQDFSRNSGAQIKTVGEFLEKFNYLSSAGNRRVCPGNRGRKKAEKKDPDERVVLLPSEAAKITEEFRKKWVR